MTHAGNRVKFSQTRFMAVKIRVRIFGDVATVVGAKHMIELEDDGTVMQLTNMIQTGAGRTRRGYLGEFKVGGQDLAILVNGKNIALLDGTSTRLKDGDDMVITPFVVGG